MNTLFEKGIFQPIEESGIYENSMTQNPTWLNRQMFMILGRTSVMTDTSARRADESGNYTTSGYVMPQMEDAKESGIEVRPAALYAINASCEHPKEAARFLAFMFGSEVEAMMTEIMQKIAYKQYQNMDEAADEVFSRIEQIVASNVN